MTPPAASNPNAEPPHRATAWTDCMEFEGLSRSVSRVPGPPPRTSTAPTAPEGQATTVTPEETGFPASSRAGACPTAMPGTSARPLTRPGTAPKTEDIEDAAAMTDPYPSSNPSGTSSSPIMALSSVSWW